MSDKDRRKMKMGSKKHGYPDLIHKGIHAYIHSGDAMSVDAILLLDPSQATMEMDGVNILYHAGSKGRLDIVNIIVEKHGLGSMINTMTGPAGSRSHPIYGAALEGHLPVVKYLVEHGADVNCKPEDGASCLLMAVQYNHIDIATYLLDHHANIDYERPGGMGSALHLAIVTEAYRRTSHFSPPSPVFRLLLARGANMELTINHKSSRVTALGLAIRCNPRLAMELYGSGALLENIRNIESLNDTEKSVYVMLKARTRPYMVQQNNAMDAKYERETQAATATGGLPLVEPNILGHRMPCTMKARCHMVDCEFSKGTGNVGEFLYILRTHTHTLSLSLSHTHTHTPSPSRTVWQDTQEMFFLYDRIVLLCGTSENRLAKSQSSL